MRRLVFVVAALCSGQALAAADGVLVLMSTDKWVAHDAIGFYLPFDIVTYDTRYFHTAAQPTRLTIPSGVTKVRLTAQAVWYKTGTGLRQLVIKKNGASSSGVGLTTGSRTMSRRPISRRALLWWT
jgi:hypothetical protein